ncbi:MAG: TatD family hydrolase [Bacteroidia bacterium]
MNSFIDTHSHLFVEQFDDDREATIARAKAAGIEKILLPNIDIESIDRLNKMVNQFPDYCCGMMGLHPCSVKTDYKSTLKAIEKEFVHNKYVAVGEIGLDYYWDTSLINEQKQAFKMQLNWAKELGLPVAIHTRDSFADALEIVKNEQNGSLSGVFHCWSGTVEEGEQVKDVGFYMGIGGVATFKKSTHQHILPHLGLDKIILETDSPYLAPVPFRGKRNESAYTVQVAQKLASIYEVGLDEIALITTKNAIDLFKL